MTTTSAEGLLPVPVDISSPCGKRSRALQQTSSDDQEESPKIQRTINTNSPATKVFENELTSILTNKENKKNSPAAKTPKRFKQITQKLKKRTSMSFLSPPKPTEISVSCNYPTGLLSPPHMTDKHMKALKEAIENPKKRNLTHLQNLEKKKPFKSPIQVPQFRQALRSTNTSQLPNISVTPRNRSVTSPTEKPSLSRSVSMYSLSPEPANNPKPTGSAKASRLSANLSRPGPKTPKKKKKNSAAVGGSFSSLRSSRRGTYGTEFKQFFSRSSSQSVEQSEEQEKTPEEPRKYNYFTQDLEELMHVQRSVFGLEDVKIPYFVHVCCTQVRSYFLQEEGLFRVSPSLSSLEEAVDLIESSSQFGKGDLMFGTGENGKPQFSAHVYSGLIKKYLRDLPDPLLGFDNYSRWISYVSEENQDALKSLIYELPTDQYNLLEAIISLAYEIQQNENVNRMSVEGLSRVIGPNILWNHQIKDPIASSEQISYINLIAQYFISNYTELFLWRSKKHEGHSEQIIGENTSDDLSSVVELSEDNSRDISEAS